MRPGEKADVSRIEVASLMAAVLLAGCGAGTAVTTPNPLVTTAPAPSARAPTGSAAVALSTGLPPGPTAQVLTFGATFPPTAVAVVEAGDPTGDVVPPNGGGPPVPAAVEIQAPAIDITHLTAWIADDALRAEVTLAGRVPLAESDLRVELAVRHGGLSFATICLPGPCVDWMPLLRFTFELTQRSDRWVVEYAIDLTEIDRVVPAEQTPDEYGVGVEATSNGWWDWGPQSLRLTR